MVSLKQLDNVHGSMPHLPYRMSRQVPRPLVISPSVPSCESTALDGYRHIALPYSHRPLEHPLTWMRWLSSSAEVLGRGGLMWRVERYRRRWGGP